MAGGRGGISRGIGRVWIGVGVVWLAAISAPALACPDCAAGVRAEVRRGIFDASFGVNFAATLAPFGIFLGVAAAIHSGGGQHREDRR